MKDPILAERNLPNGRIVVEGGLHYIKGNKLPYFSLTATEYNVRGRDVAGGAMHDRIVKLFPRYRDLAAMHLSDIRGVPMYAVENGWYFARSGQFLVSGRWDQVNRDCSPEDNLDKCQASLCRLLRITWEEAEPLMALGALWRDAVEAADASSAQRVKDTKAAFVGLLKGMEPRWKAEAEECIQKFGLVVYGDQWIDSRDVVTA